MKHKGLEGLSICYLLPEEFKNPGDMIIKMGVDRIIDSIFPGNTKDFILTDTDHMPAGKDIFDVIVVVGTPWIWDMCERSIKYRQLSQLIDTNRTAKKIALGIGTCIPLDSGPSLILEKYETKTEILRILGKFNIITARDSLTSYILDIIGVRNILLPCPASLAYRVKGNKKSRRSPLLVFYDPAKGISSGCLSDEFKKQYLEKQKMIYKLFHPQVIALTSEELDSASGIGIKVELCKNPNEIFCKLNNSSIVISGRVHCAIPAAMMKKTSFILPVDSRYLTTSSMNVFTHFIDDSMESFEIAHLKSRDNACISNELSQKKIMRDYCWHIKNALKGI